MIDLVFDGFDVFVEYGVVVGGWFCGLGGRVH